MKSTLVTEDPWQKVCILKKLTPPKDIDLHTCTVYLFITHPNDHPMNPQKIAIVDLRKMIRFLPSSCKEFYLTS